MAASADQVARLRKMVAEPTTTTYSDVALKAYIEAYPLVDERGEAPYTFSSATPPARVENTGWMPTYDLNAAAADVWDEKAAALAANFDFQVDGGDYSRSQAFEHAQARARYYRSRRAPMTVTATQWPDESTLDDFPWIGNLPEGE